MSSAGSMLRNGKKYRRAYLVCRTAKQRGACSQRKGVPFDDVLGQRQDDGSFRGGFMEWYGPLLAEAVKIDPAVIFHDDPTIPLRDELAAVEGEIAKLADAIARVPNIEPLVARLEQTRDRKHDLEGQIA